MQPVACQGKRWLYFTAPPMALHCAVQPPNSEGCALPVLGLRPIVQCASSIAATLEHSAWALAVALAVLFRQHQHAAELRFVIRILLDSLGTDAMSTRAEGTRAYLVAGLHSPCTGAGSISATWMRTSTPNSGTYRSMKRGPPSCSMTASHTRGCRRSITHRYSLSEASCTAGAAQSWGVGLSEASRTQAQLWGGVLCSEGSARLAEATTHTSRCNPHCSVASKWAANG